MALPLEQRKKETEFQRTQRYLDATYPIKYVVSYRLTPFIISLLEMDSRIRIFELYDELEEDMGYIPRKDMICIPYVLPSADHEIAHMVEMKNPERWTLPDLGMRHPRLGMKTAEGIFAALAREVRVRAIQSHMTPSLNNPRFPEKHPYWEDEVTKRLPFGRFKSPETLFDWAENLYKRTHSAWNLDRIRHEWEIRINHIQNWMETKVAA